MIFLPILPLLFFALTFSRCPFFCIFLSSPTLFSPSLKGPFLSQLSAQKLYGGTSWLQAKTLLSDSFSVSVLVSSNHSICNTPPPTRPTPLFPPLFLFFLLHFFFFPLRRQSGQKVWDLESFAQMFPFTHTCTLWGGWEAVGLQCFWKGCVW